RTVAERADEQCAVDNTFDLLRDLCRPAAVEATVGGEATVAPVAEVALHAAQRDHWLERAVVTRRRTVADPRRRGRRRGCVAPRVQDPPQHVRAAGRRGRLPVPREQQPHILATRARLRLLRLL